MKVVFLDIDGVLNDWNNGDPQSEYRQAWAEGRNDEPWRLILPHLVAKVESLCARTNAVIVISSSWRNLFLWRELIGFLCRQGLSARIVGRTPSIGDRRGDEIAEWLGENLGIEAYVILDDDDDAGIGHDDHFVQTDPSVGITDADVERAIEILGQP